MTQWSKLVAAMALAATLAAACGPAKAPDNGGSASPQTGASSNAAPSIVDKAKQELAKFTAAQTTLPPSDGPKAARDKFVVIIPCSMAAEGCVRQAKGTEEAAKAIGWRSLLIDPKGDPAQTQKAIETAVAQKADGIVLNAIDASSVSGPIAAARAAGVHVVVTGGPDPTGKTVEAEVPRHDAFVDDGRAQAWYVVSALGGKGKIAIFNDPEFPAIVDRIKGAKEVLAQCPDCQVVAEESFMVTQLSTTFPQQVVSVVRKNPDLAAIIFPYDAAVAAAQPVLQSSGLIGKIIAVSGDGNAQNIGYIKDGNFQRATTALPMEWEGWGAIDALNRLFQGKPVVDENVRFRMITKDNLADALPNAGAYAGDVDFRSAYRSVWGVQAQ